MLARLFAATFSLLLGWVGTAQGQNAEQSSDEDTVFLVAHPAFRDAGYYHSVLIAAPLTGGGHVGVILNRPIGRPLISLFPEHEPSKKVADSVRYGGPFSPGALVAVVKSDKSPGDGTLPLMKNLFITFRAATIDKVIEETPNEARYFVGYVGWRPGELKSEIDRGLWSVVPANPDTVFQKDLNGLWEELLAQTRRLQAEGKRALPHPLLTLLQTPSRLSSSRP
jgi:putative transcriptional regulator